jgi:anti-anti-sigma factor
MTYRPSINPLQPDCPFGLLVSEGSSGCVVAVAGSLDPNTSWRLDEVLNREMNLGVPRLRISLRRVSSIDGTGLAVLNRAHNRARSRGCQLTLVTPDGGLWAALDSAGMWRCGRTSRPASGTGPHPDRGWRGGDGAA